MPVEGSEYLIDADVVVVAVGVSPNPIVPRSVAGLEVSKKGTIVVNDATMQSNLPEFYAGGDIVRGGATVILAMGRRTPGSCSYGCSAKIVIGLYREGAGPKVLAFVVSSYLFFTSFLIRVKKRLQR